MHMISMRRFAPTLLILAALTSTRMSHIAAQAAGQKSEQEIAVDSDHDGLSDSLEQALLIQFAPTFMVGRQDCAGIPAEFTPNVETPTVQAEDGTIYGQVFPVASLGDGMPAVEIHFYHLWKIDCGPHGHNLDTEHVAVLVSASERDVDAAKWKAVYWYAAAHENTVCDVSQIARASTVGGVEGGARVWVSPGKHASYLNETLCGGGCGADKCVDMVALRPGKLVNLGEAGDPMNGSAFIASNEWPLMAKMSATNFPQESIARVSGLQDGDIAWTGAGKRSKQQIIAVSGATERAIAGGVGGTAGSLGDAAAATGAAISVTEGDTGDALAKSATHTGHALGTAARAVGEALHLVKKPEKAE
jgi:hypothetical protein